MLPVVSICIPTYKEIEFLKKNLDSILIQTYKNYEVIITDDSPDNSVKALAESYGPGFEGKLFYFKNTIALGSPENWNEAVRKAKGKYIKLLHHDDWFSSETSLASFVKMLDEDQNADFAFCSSNIIEIETNFHRQNVPSQEQLKELSIDPEILFFGNFIGPPSSTIYRKGLNIQYDSKVKYVVDVDFYIEVLKKNRKFVFATTPLITNTSKHANQVTEQSLDAKTQLGEYSYLFNKINHSFIPNKKYLSFFKSLFLKYSVKSMHYFQENKISSPRPYFIFSLLISYLKINKLYRN